jgi:aminobenzoyl-glutamate utilization protein B
VVQLFIVHARSPDASILNGVWERILKCAQAGALASEIRFEFEQGTNYANILPNDALAEVLGRGLQRAGGYQYTPEERRFAQDLQKSLDSSSQRSGPDSVLADKSETNGSASSDVGDVSWVVPMAFVDRNS